MRNMNGANCVVWHKEIALQGTQQLLVERVARIEMNFSTE